MVTELLNKVKEEAGKAVHAIEEQCHGKPAEMSEDEALVAKPQPSTLKDMTQRKIAEAVNDFAETLPLLEQAGLHLQNFEVEFGISPKLIPRFIIKHIPTKEEQDDLLQHVRGRRVVQSILTSLFKALDLQHHLKVGKMKLLGLEVYIAAIPTVRLLFGEQLLLKSEM